MMSLWVSVLVAASPASLLQDARVGEWVQYRVDGGGGRVAYLRLAVVAQERDASGRDALWLELELGTAASLEAPIARIAVLAARESGLTSAGVSRLIVGAGAGRPEELPPGQFGAFLPAVLASAGRDGRATAPSARIVTGERTLPTPRGPLQVACTETLSGQTLLHRLCVDPRIPLLGIAELSLPELGHSLRLHAYGTAATRRMPAPRNPPTIGQER